MDGKIIGDKEEEKKKEKKFIIKIFEGGKDFVKLGSLIDICFVLIDVDLMDVFEREFVKRFGSCDKVISDDDDDDEV